MQFQDKVVVITGAAGGFGSVGVRRFAAEGGRVVAADLHEEPLRRPTPENDPRPGLGRLRTSARPR